MANRAKAESAADGIGTLTHAAQEGRGALLYLRQEGRGIGLLNKLRAYALQDAGADTVEANTRLGFDVDRRDYAAGAQLLRALGVGSVQLLTNNPDKITGLQRFGVDVRERIPLQVGRSQHNWRYLATKASKLGHLLLDSSASPRASGTHHAAAAVADDLLR
jgi:GTP cyclohydrolase II